MLSGTSRPKTEGLKPRMYPSAPPPLFSKVWEASTLYTVLMGKSYHKIEKEAISPSFIDNIKKLAQI